MTPVLQLRGLTKRHCVGPLEVPVLTGVDLDVAAGEFVAIVGASGAGKTTLLHLLGLLDRPDGGRQRLDGTEVSELDDDARTVLRNRAIGFVFQSSPLLPRLTARENVALPLLYRGVRPREARQAAEAALARFGLAAQAGHHPGQMSGGEQQRAGLARAIVGRPRVLLADEPTAALDAGTAADVLDILLSLHRQDGLTIVLVTHEEETAALAGRRFELTGGRLVSRDTVSGPA